MALPQVKLGALEARLSRMQPIDTGWSVTLIETIFLG